VKICNSTIAAGSSSGGTIGGNVDSVSFSGRCWIEFDGCGPITASSISISNASLIFIANAAPLFAASPSSVRWFDVVIAYRTVTMAGTEHLSSLEGPFLRTGNLSIPDRDLGSLEFCVRKGRTHCENSFECCFENRAGLIQSAIVPSLTDGLYSFPGWLNAHDVNCATSDGRVEFVVDLNSSFIDVLFLRAARDSSGNLQIPPD
jgi:hypothetical protein